MSIQRTKALFERVRHPFSARHVQLLAREYISPNFIRLTLGGPDMAGFKSLGFDDHVKLILPQAGQQKPNLPYLVDEKPQVDEPRPIMRDYTPLNYDERLNTIELDFALHTGNGAAMQWAKTAPIGQWAGLAGPRGSWVIAPGLDWYVLLGDETALPAIERCLQERPFDAPMMVRIACADPRDQRAWALDEQVDMRYVPTLDGVLDTLSLGAGTGFIWGAGEHNQMAALRTALLGQGLHARQMHLSAYWRAAD